MLLYIRCAHSLSLFSRFSLCSLLTFRYPWKRREESVEEWRDTEIEREDNQKLGCWLKGNEGSEKGEGRGRNEAKQREKKALINSKRWVNDGAVGKMARWRWRWGIWKLENMIFRREF